MDSISCECIAAPNPRAPEERLFVNKHEEEPCVVDRSRLGFFVQVYYSLMAITYELALFLEGGSRRTQTSVGTVAGDERARRVERKGEEVFAQGEGEIGEALRRYCELIRRISTAS